jgi:hypothetical protein
MTVRAPRPAEEGLVGDVPEPTAAGQSGQQPAE